MSHSKSAPVRPLQIAATITIALFATVSAVAQANSAATDVRPSHIDVYGGYAYIHPFHSAVAGVPYHDVGNLNTTVSIADYFTRHLGLQVEGSYFSGGSKHGVALQCAPSCSSRDQLFYAAEAGPIVRFPTGHFTPYVHVLAGGAKVNGPYAQPLTWGSGLTGGGGLDYSLPFFGNHLAIRLFQADMYYSHVDYPRVATVQTSTSGSVPGRSNVGDVIAIKGSAGLVLKLGSIGPPPVPLTLACTVQPETAYPGDAVTLTCTPGNLVPKRKADYTYTASAGRVTPSGASASIATAGLAPGSYMVMARLIQGAKPWQQASWTGSFNIKNFDPPTLTVTVLPQEIATGDSATITAAGISPQNRALTYSCSAPTGQISGTGATETFSALAVPPGPVSITCTVTDDQGRSSSASTTITILGERGASSSGTGTGSGTGASSQGLCSISFERDRKRPVRVNNEAKACLDGIALSLREYTDRLVITGHQEPGESSTAAAQRARNESLYLVQEKGIDASRLELRATPTGGRSVDNTLLHRGGSSPSASGTTVLDPSTIPHDGEAYGRPRAHSRHPNPRHRKPHHP